MIETYVHTKEKKLKYFGEGEWINEPDVVEFEHKGIKCQIRRMFIIEERPGCESVFGGYLCGYVQVPKDHPYFGKDFKEELDIHAHGGLTYSAQGENDWWIGFDCAHAGDIIPSTQKLRKKDPFYIEIQKDKEQLMERCAKFFPSISRWKETYRTIDYCIQECKNIAEQLINIQIGPK